MHKKLLIIATMSLVLFSTNLLAQAFSSLEERMTAAEFRQSGLEKLSPEELEALNDWIRGHSLGGVEGGPGLGYAAGDGEGDRRGFRDFRGEPTTIAARIKGTFNGWNGETVFELDNGMIWKQAEQDKLGVRARENPDITIEPGFLGAWYLNVPGINKRLRVRRIE